MSEAHGAAAPRAVASGERSSSDGAGALAGLVGLVTGGGSGIGRASALAIAAGGARVVVGDVDPSAATETARQIREAGGEGIAVAVDVTVDAEVEALVHAATETYGRLDFAHNNAGISGDVATTVDCTEANWDRTIAVNLTGVWLCMRYELRQMLAQGPPGSIVNTAAGAGLAGVAGFPAYVASKHGVIGLTRTAALEYAEAGIRVNAVCPGTTATPMVATLTGRNPATMTQIVAGVPMGRLAEPQEITAAVVWLCSEAASFVTGHALVVDGGVLAG